MPSPAREFTKGSPTFRASRLSLLGDDETNLVAGDGSLPHIEPNIFQLQMTSSKHDLFPGAAGLIAAIKQKSLSRAYSTNVADGDISFNRPMIPETNERMVDLVLETFLNGYGNCFYCFVGGRLNFAWQTVAKAETGDYERGGVICSCE